MGQDPSYVASLPTSPVGPLSVIVQDGAVVRLEWSVVDGVSDAVATEAISQLAQYFAGERQVFDLPLGPQVSDFQKKFGAALCAIRFGETRTYGELAREMGVPAQAIGQACGANPIPSLSRATACLVQRLLAGFRALVVLRERCNCCAMRARQAF